MSPTDRGSRHLHLLRHADAGDPEAWRGDDAARPLSPKGEAQAERLGAFLAGAGFRTDAVISSPKVRARRTAEIVADLVRLWGVPTSTEIATCLLTGIYGDTLGLRTEATTARTMRTAADLVDAGANPAAITDALFRVKPMSTVCLWERALRNTRWTGPLIWTEVTQEVLAECGAKPSEAEGLVNFLAGTEGSRAAAILYAVSGGWRVSLRSLPSDVDVAAIEPMPVTSCITIHMAKTRFAGTVITL